MVLDCEWGCCQRKRVTSCPTAHLARSLSHSSSVAQPSQEAIKHTWYDHYYRGRDSYLALLFPNPFYPEPWAVPRSWTVPVGTEDCDNTQEICNGHLKPGFQYR